MSQRINKILLIRPPVHYYKSKIIMVFPPLGLAYIAAVLERNGYKVEILDALAEGYKNKVKDNRNFIRCGLSLKEIKNKISECSPDMVGVSSTFIHQARLCHQICRVTKEIDVNIKTLVGGQYPTNLPEECLKDNNTDYIIIGEGEYSALNLVNAINENKDLSSIDSIGYINEGKIHITPKVNYIDDLDALAYPARHLLPMGLYTEIHKSLRYSKRIPATTIETSRGCPYKCSFCSINCIWGREFRTRSVNFVLDEMQHLKDTYGIKEIHFIDENLTFDKQRAKAIFEGMINRGFDFSWSTPEGFAVWLLDEELINLIKKSGCYHVRLAIESGNQNTLDNLKKPLLLTKAEAMIRQIKDLGMKTEGLFVIGFPGETKDTIWETINFANNLPLDEVSIAIANPFPGTGLYEICKEQNYFANGFELSNLVFPKANLQTPEFDPEEVEIILETDRILSLLRKKKKSLFSILKETIQRNGINPIFLSMLLRSCLEKNSHY